MRAASSSTPGREPGTTASQGYLHCGQSGAGHFVKMVHNGIEYGMMAAIAEGLSIIKGAGIGLQENATHDAETTPLRDPEAYQYDIDVTDVAEVWRRGSVVSSWLIDLAAAALAKSPTLEEFGGRVSDSGEGRWTVEAAIDEGVPAPSSPRRCTSASSRGTSAYSPARCSRPCGRSSAGTRRRNEQPRVTALPLPGPDGMGTPSRIRT